LDGEDDALRVMTDVRVASAELLARHGKYPLFSEHLPDTSPAQQAYIAQRMAGLGYFRYFEFFSPTQSYIEALLPETQGGLPIMARQLLTPALDITASIAAFLLIQAAKEKCFEKFLCVLYFFLIQGKYSYYSASTGWFDKDWAWHQEHGPNPNPDPHLR
jgi:hypothetical protein